MIKRLPLKFRADLQSDVNIQKKKKKLKQARNYSNVYVCLKSLNTLDWILSAEDVTTRTSSSSRTTNKLITVMRDHLFSTESIGMQAKLLIIPIKLLMNLINRKKPIERLICCTALKAKICCFFKIDEIFCFKGLVSDCCKGYLEFFSCSWATWQWISSR